MEELYLSWITCFLLQLKRPYQMATFGKEGLEKVFVCTRQENSFLLKCMHIKGSALLKEK